MIAQILQEATAVAKVAPDLKKLKAATDGFQQAFVKQLVTEMRKSSESEFGDIPGSGIYEDMTNEVLAQKLSSNGGFGISEKMYKQLEPLTLSQAMQRNKTNP